MWLLATILDSRDTEHFHPHRKFYGQHWHRTCLRVVPSEGPEFGLFILPSRSVIGAAPGGVDSGYFQLSWLWLQEARGWGRVLAVGAAEWDRHGEC